MNDASIEEQEARGSTRRYDRLVAFILVTVAALSLWFIYRTPQNDIKWYTEFEPALAVAARDQKPMLLYFTSTGCVYCWQMEKNVWPVDAVEEAINRFYVPVKVNLSTAAARELGARYNVAGTPTVVLTDSSGTEKGTFEGALTPEQMLKVLNVPETPR